MKDITGCRSGRLVAVRPDRIVGTAWFWWCRCDCGAEKSVRGGLITRGLTKSCGCLVGDVRRQRAAAKKNKYVPCEQCGAGFMAASITARFCSRECHRAATKGRAQPARLSGDALRQAALERYLIDADAGRVSWREDFRHRGNRNAVPGYVCDQGYHYISIQGRHYKRSRIVYLVATGAEPEVIDHINRDRLDDRIANLRAADRQTNGQNSATRKNNSSGHRGVSWNKETRRWRAYITVMRKQRIREFRSKEDAIRQRLRWEAEFFGEFRPKAA